MPPKKGTKYKKRVTTTAMKDGARDRTARKLERQRSAALKLARTERVAERSTAADAVALYRAERDKSAQRLAAKQAADMETCRLAIARLESERDTTRRGGRRKLPNLHLRSDPANALVNACTPWRGDGA